MSSPRLSGSVPRDRIDLFGSLYLMKQLLAAGIILATLGGTAFAQYPPPPPLYREVVPVRPGPRYVWQPGHWVWNGYGYAWVRGRYIAVTPAYRRWVHGHWSQGPGGWVWVPAHWR